jgi:hypothetical protein
MYNGLSQTLATPRTLPARQSLASVTNITAPQTVGVVERIPTATKPVTTLTGTSAGIVVAPGLNYLKIMPMINASNTPFTIGVIGWSYVEETDLWVPTPIAYGTATSAAAGSATVDGQTMFGALTLGAVTTGDRKNFAGQQYSTRWGAFVVDCLGSELIELVIHQASGGQRANAFVAGF